MGTVARDIDEYIAGFSPDVQEVLEAVRAAIRAAAPDAEETIKYQMPTFTLEGNLIHFAAFRNHIGLYPAPAGSEELQKKLSAYRGAKASLRFPLDEPIPLDLIGEIVKARVRENLEKAEARRNKK
jgi:uncharacterized protein YdhG (YjbR/CyaY superfamily)